ncbi:MAG: prepilin-type N-terminal cleavage/methylation domain-containing protein [Candidatus Omnitrophica bacterium]|nr:prepilin-type N-terminal cleavage/methylation domain-containing protein [Candidatus Omnitrophota bacterium]
MIRVRWGMRRRGFSLVEALLAAIILGVSLIALGAVFYDQFAIINRAREMTIATLCAQEEIEQVRGMPFDDIVNLSSSFTATGFAYLDDPAGTVTVSNSYGDDIKKISVTVSWKNSLSGTTLTRSMATLVSRYGINKQ